jgi:hypothetical protein
LATLAWFLEHAAREASLGRIEIRTMGSYAEGPARSNAAGAHAVA